MAINLLAQMLRSQILSIHSHCEHSEMIYHKAFNKRSILAKPRARRDLDKNSFEPTDGGNYTRVKSMGSTQSHILYPKPERAGMNSF